MQKNQSFALKKSILKLFLGHKVKKLTILLLIYFTMLIFLLYCAKSPFFDIFSAKTPKRKNRRAVYKNRYLF